MLKRVLLILAAIMLIAQYLDAGNTFPVQPKNEKTALKYSIKGTVYPVVAGAVIFFGLSEKFYDWNDGGSILAASIAGSGLIFGPALGHCYAGKSGYLLKGFLLRGLPLGMIVVSASLSNCFGNDFNPGCIVLPVSIAIFSAIHDISTVKKSIGEFNDRAKSSRVSFYPHYFPDKKAPGLMISCSF